MSQDSQYVEYGFQVFMFELVQNQKTSNIAKKRKQEGMGNTSRKEMQNKLLFLSHYQ